MNTSTVNTQCNSISQICIIIKVFAESCLSGRVYIGKY